MKAMIGVLAFVVLGALWQVSAFASGSISIGGGISPRDAYTQGKKLTFKKLVCSSCPIQRSELDQTRAQSLKNSLEAREAESKPGTPDDEHIQVLCPGSRGADCGSVDEQELVHYYLTRRYKL